MQKMATATIVKPEDIAMAAEYYQTQGHNKVTSVKLAVSDSLDTIGF